MYVAEAVFPKHSMKIDEFKNHCTIQIIKKIDPVMYIVIENSIDVFNREDLVCSLYKWRRYLFKKLENMDKLTNDILMIYIWKYNSQSNNSYAITANTGNNPDEFYNRIIETNSLAKDVKSIVKEILDLYIVNNSV